MPFPARRVQGAAVATAWAASPSEPSSKTLRRHALSPPPESAACTLSGKPENPALSAVAEEQHAIDQTDTKSLISRDAHERTCHTSCRSASNSSPMSRSRHARTSVERGRMRSSSRGPKPLKLDDPSALAALSFGGSASEPGAVDPVMADEAAAVRMRVMEEMNDVAEAAARVYDLGGDSKERPTAFLYRGCAAQVATSTAGMYGEMVESSVRQVVQYMRHYGGDEFSVFLDLGSGRGAPSCIALYQQPWLACLGIEKCPQAYSLSLETHRTVLRREMNQSESIPPPSVLPSVLSPPQSDHCGRDSSSAGSCTGVVQGASPNRGEPSGSLCGGGRPGGRVPRRRMCFQQEDLSAFYHLEGVTHVYSFDAAMEGPLINWIVQMFMRTKTWYLYASFRSDLISKFDLGGASLVGQVSSSMWVSSEGRTTYIYVKNNWRACKAYHRRWLRRFLFSHSACGPVAGPRRLAGSSLASTVVVRADEEQQLASKKLQITTSEAFRLLFLRQEELWSEFEGGAQTPGRSLSPARDSTGAVSRLPSSPSDMKNRGRSSSRRRANSLSGHSKHLQLQSLQLQAARQCCAHDRLPECLRLNGPLWASEQEDLDETGEGKPQGRRGTLAESVRQEQVSEEAQEEAELREMVKTFKSSFFRISQWLQPLTVLDMLRLAFLPGEGQAAWLDHRQQQLTGGGVLTRTRRPTALGFNEHQRRQEELERDALLEFLAKADDPADVASCRQELAEKLEMWRRESYSVFPYSLLQESELPPNVVAEAHRDAEAIAERLAHLLTSSVPRSSSFSPVASPASSRRPSATALASLRRLSSSPAASPQRAGSGSDGPGFQAAGAGSRPRVAQPGATVVSDFGTPRTSWRGDRYAEAFDASAPPLIGGSQPTESLHAATPLRGRSRRASTPKDLLSRREASELVSALQTLPSNAGRLEHTPSPPLKRRGINKDQEPKGTPCDSATPRMTPKTRAAYREVEQSFQSLEIRSALSRRKRRAMPEGETA
ncbi:hypothetical protein BESB_080000 [Besnoitia besnoiti]|uniref:DOT1 domain-containing protein n=1 Tax=Besnoitia besnoiti TaxID=94643 RepID=A0A2A9M9A7_BESBE|nr:hypothetical protein BESB_080000 [Besnoitia besnoiti]PFH33784.1 hypothetical protein BESB_080000 [Besnoitia besnoiti]